MKAWENPGRMRGFLKVRSSVYAVERLERGDKGGVHHSKKKGEHQLGLVDGSPESPAVKNGTKPLASSRR